MNDKRISLETLDMMFDSFEVAYYEGAGDDAWYRDHNTEPGCQLDKDASVHHYWKEYLKSFPDEGVKK